MTDRIRAKELRAKAEKCRALASANTDEKTVATLKAYAVELDTEAEALEGQESLPAQAIPSAAGSEPHTDDAAALKAGSPDPGEAPDSGGSKPRS